VFECIHQNQIQGHLYALFRTTRSFRMGHVDVQNCTGSSHRWHLGTVLAAHNTVT